MISSFEHPWLGALFGDEEAAELWSAQAQFYHYLSFEKALALALEAAGVVSAGQGSRAADAVDLVALDEARLATGTARDGLPIPEFVRQLRDAAGDAKEAIHTGATSQDVLDTALGLTLRSVSNRLVTRLASLDAALSRVKTVFGDNVLMGRTRMQAALPIQVADRIDAWRLPLKNHAEALTALRPVVERLQLGGAVGTRAAFGANADAIARHMAESLELHNGPVWHSERSGIAEYAGRLSLISGSLGKIGQDIALMAQQGIEEIRLMGGGGSSAMPHKSNPVLAELLVTLARYNATQVSAIHQALVHEQERSGAAWMLEWMVLPAMTVTTARALSVAQDLCEQIEQIGTR